MFDVIKVKKKGETLGFLSLGSWLDFNIGKKEQFHDLPLTSDCKIKCKNPAPQKQPYQEDFIECLVVYPLWSNLQNVGYFSIILIANKCTEMTVP